MADLTGKSILELGQLSPVPDDAAYAVRSSTDNNGQSRYVTFGDMRKRLLMNGIAVPNGADLDNYRPSQASPNDYIGAYYVYFGDGKTVYNWPGGETSNGGVLYVVAGTTYQNTVQIAIVTAITASPMYIRQWNGTTWSAWKTVTYDGITTSGGTMTGSLVINTLQDATQANANLRLKDSRFAIGDNADSTKVVGRVQYWDKNQDVVAFVNGQYNANKVSQLQLSAQSKKDGAAVNNTLTLGVNTNGERTVSVSYPAAWREAIGNERTAPTVIVETSDYYTIDSDAGGVYVDRCDAVNSVTLPVKVVASTSMWTAVLSGLNAPSHAVYMTVPTNRNIQLGDRGLNVRITSGGVMQVCQGTADQTYRITLTYIAR